jgi:hypothetical protein
MNRLLALFLLCLPPAALPAQLVVCGWDEVFVLDLDRNPPAKVWTWKAADRPELPAHMRDKFRTTDECKPLDGGRRILVTASSDGVAVVEHPSGRVTFYAQAANAHSAELLPNDRIVVAASHRPNAAGDRLILFDLDKPERPLYQTELSWAHAVLWDEQRQILWALSSDDLRAYRLKNWSGGGPELEKLAAYPLPDTGGHDLQPVPGTALLTVTTERRCWLFDRDARRLSPHPQLAAERNVKCIVHNPRTGQVLWIQAEGGNWWTEKLRFLNPERLVQLPGEHLYKARWLPAGE